METGHCKHPFSGEPIPRHYIQPVVCEHNDDAVLSFDCGWGVSANPYLAFEVLDGAAGDTVAVRWTDSRGLSAALETAVE